ncbi:MAG: AtpZ/AtpI family protein [Lacipirellulaceae bacterium]
MASPDPEQPMAAAMQWVSRIFAAAMLMVLPGLAGQWLDGKLGTSFLVLIGFAGGLIAGMAYLIAQTKQAELRRQKHNRENPTDSREDKA